MKKTLITILATVLVCCCVVGGTLAWLMDKTEAVVNTFTVGNVDITLAESVDTNADNAESFKMVPGATITKDPKVTVLAGSEECWVFVKIEESNNLDDFISYTVDTATWKALDETNHPGVYYYKQSALTADGAVNAVKSVLANDQVTVLSTVTKDMMDAIDNDTAIAPTLTFTAYAIQTSTQEALNTVEEAWAEVSK